MPYSRPPLKIGLSPRFLYKSPLELGFRGKTLQYLEQSIAHWVMSHGALVFMLPSIETGGLIQRGNLSVEDYVEAVDGLVLQGGTDV
jgi:putative glutamine amidotransferase